MITLQITLRGCQSAKWTELSVKLNLERHSANIIHSYDAGAVKIQTKYRPAGVESDKQQQGFITLTASLIITPEILIEDWLENAPALSSTDMDRVIETHPEVILLGTGNAMNFPDNAIIQRCYQEKIGFEVMNTAAACRTYNVLVSEQRKVAAALMII